jgi:hypothetical protein
MSSALQVVRASADTVPPTGNKRRVRKAAIALSLALAGTAAVTAPAARATEVLVAGSGTWGANVATSAYSVAGETFNFSFRLPEQISANPTTEATNFIYTLNGSPVTTMLTGVVFYSYPQGGLFDLDFADANVLTFFEPGSQTGPDVGTSLVLQLGSYAAGATLNGGYSNVPGDYGNGNITISQVPEPGSFVLLGAGLMALAAKRRHRA